MARNEGDVLAQRPELLRDRIDQLLVIAQREVGAPDAAGEQHVADHRELARPVDEDDVAWRVARAMEHVERQLADRHRVAIGQPTIGFEHAAVDPEARAVIIQPADPEPVRLVRALDRQAQLLGELAGLAAMVDMTVRYQDLLELDARLGDRRAQLGKIAARIDQRAAIGRGAPESASSFAATASPAGWRLSSAGSVWHRS